jgi:hypothetical protein
MAELIRPDHPCFIGVAPIGTGSYPVVDRSWCFDRWAEKVVKLPDDFPESAWPPPDWILFREGDLEVAYTPFDWVNTAARVALVGITPGRHQAWVAAVEAARALREGCSHEEALRRADASGSFSGPMRRNLVAMLDGIDLPDVLGISSSEQLFGDAHHLAAHLSAMSFPVFIRGENYTGHTPNLIRSTVLSSLARQMLGGYLHLIPRALVIPLGGASESAVRLLVADGTLDTSRCLFGFPHPSPANGHRCAQYRQRASELRSGIATWAASSG